MTELRLDGESCQEIVEQMAVVVAENREMLSSLDALVGDGDHGSNMSAALNAAAGMVKNLERPSPSEVFITTGSVLMNEMGGASGMIFGSMYLGGGRAIKNIERLSAPDVVTFLQAAVSKVQARGKAQVGDKTMVDALAPAVESFSRSVADGKSMCQALGLAVRSARAGAEATRQMVARFGRAKFLGERAIGHQDAGATTVYLILMAWADTVCSQTTQE